MTTKNLTRAQVLMLRKVSRHYTIGLDGLSIVTAAALRGMGYMSMFGYSGSITEAGRSALAEAEKDHG